MKWNEGDKLEYRPRGNSSPMPGVVIAINPNGSPVIDFGKGVGEWNRGGHIWAAYKYKMHLIEPAVKEKPVHLGKWKL